MSEEESARALENDELFIILSYDYDRQGYQERYPNARLAECNTYSSTGAEVMSVEDIKVTLNGHL